jgi:single-strand DNA-binding protein
VHRAFLFPGTSSAALVGWKITEKGKQVYVEGKLQTRSWEDGEGNKRYSTEANISNMVMLGDGGGKESQETAEEASISGSEEDVPF